MDSFLDSLLKGSNFPPEGQFDFMSSDHIRFQNGLNVSGHNYGAHRMIRIEKNIEGHEGYTVTMFNLDGKHPVWHDNIQMAPKQMRIEKIEGDIIQFRGYGYDSLGGSFADYGIFLLVSNNDVERIQLNLIDRNINIVYLK